MEDVKVDQTESLVNPAAAVHHSIEIEFKLLPAYELKQNIGD